MPLLPMMLAALTLAATSPADQLLNSLSGTWTCERQSGTKTTPNAATWTFMRWGNWSRLQVSENGNDAEDNYLGYDERTKQWVNVAVADDGRYTVTTSNASPTASKQTWTSAFPQDSLHRVVIEQFLGDKIVVDRTTEIDGKTEPIHEVCTKQS